jgi:hypothetical protein
MGAGDGILSCSLLNGHDFVGSYVDERRLLNEGGADHQPVMLRPPYELSAEAGKGTLYHFDPCALDKILVRFDRTISRGDLLERGDLLVLNGFRFQDAYDTRDTRGPTNSQTIA